LLQIVTELVFLGEEQLGDGAAILRRKISGVQQAEIVIDVGPGDILVHDATPLSREGLMLSPITVAGGMGANAAPEAARHHPRNGWNLIAIKSFARHRDIHSVASVP
jgi:hypothetical protein